MVERGQVIDFEHICFASFKYGVLVLIIGVTIIIYILHKKHQHPCDKLWDIKQDAQ